VELNTSLSKETRLANELRDQAKLYLDTVLQQDENLLQKQRLIEPISGEKQILEQRAAQREYEHERLRLRTSDLEDRILSLSKEHQTQIDSMKAQMTSMSLQYSKNAALKVAELDAMNQKLLDLHHKSELTQRMMEIEAENQSKALSGEISKLQDELTSQSNFLHSALDHARAQMEALLYEKEQLLASTSWKMTKPLRVLAGALLQKSDR
jgi:hypothetical protein